VAVQRGRAGRLTRAPGGVEQNVTGPVAAAARRGKEGREGWVIAGEVHVGLKTHCRFAPPFIFFIQDSLTYSVALFLKQQCDRTLGPRGQRPPLAGDARCARGCRGTWARVTIDHVRRSALQNFRGVGHLLIHSPTPGRTATVENAIFPRASLAQAGSAISLVYMYHV
jgi:hypothetical protein